MPTLLVHALSASAVQATICAAIIGQGFHESVLYASIVAILVDLDHRSDEVRSSVFHSLFAILLCLLVIAVSVIIFSGALPKILAISVFVGFATHVILDMTDRRGVFIFPWSVRRVLVFRSRNNRGYPRRRTDLITAVLSGSVLLVLICL